MICVAWKWLGGKRIYHASLLDDAKRFKKNPIDDYDVVSQLHELIQKADIIVGHNMARFDWRKFMARVIHHRLPPIARPLIVDTLKEARKVAAFTSNKMDYLAKHLGVEHKLHHAGDMWLRCLRGEAGAVKEAVEYCRGDITTTEAIYLRLRPYMENHPNHNMFVAKGVACCRNCGSTHLVVNAHRTTLTHKYIQYKCEDCGKHSSGSKSVHKAVLR